MAGEHSPAHDPMARMETLTLPDGTRLKLHDWPLERLSHGRVLIVHGLGEHGGRYAHVAAALNRAGWQVQAYDLSVAASSVGVSQMGRQNIPTPGPDLTIVAGAWDQPFAIPHYRVTGYRMPAMVPVSSWRSVGASANGFLHDCFLDELIWAAGADPLAERIRLCSHEPSRRVLEAVGELSGWGTPLPKGRGRGVAFTLSFGVPTAEVVEVTATPKGIRIDKAFVVAEVGQVLDPVNIEAQMTGGMLWGLGHAMLSELTYADGAPQQTNFHDYPSLRMYQVPQIVAKALQNTGAGHII